MAELLVKNLDVVFLIYGASFLVMAIVILAQPRHESNFKLAGIIWLLAGFGISHGINEWLDMFVIIKNFNSQLFNFIRTALLTVSFVFLFEFGRKLAVLELKRFFTGWFTIVLSSAVIILILTSTEDKTIWPRYLLGLPGGILASWGIIRYYYSNKRSLKLFKIGNYFIFAGISLGAYGVLAGIVVPRADFFPASSINNASFLNIFKIPVQAFRAICASILAWAVYNILGVFKHELISSLKNSLQQIAAAKDFTEDILASLFDALFVFDASSRIKLVNETTCQMLGYEKNELMNMSVKQLFEEEAPFATGKFKKLLEDGDLKNYELVCISKSGEKIPLLFSETIMKNSKGEFLGIVGIGKDLRELNVLREKLTRAEKLAAMGKIAGIISHEFKNHLGVIRNAVYFLKIKLAEADSKIINNLTILEQQAVESNNLIDNIMIFGATKQLQMQPIDLKSILSGAVNNIRLAQDVRITIQIEEKLPEIMADKVKIIQVFSNIIKNALEAMRGKGELLIRVFSGNDYVEVVFTDSGPGISQEIKRKIFEPFFSTKPLGMGLGLTTSNFIIEVHGGVMEIDNASDKGAVVKIKLPTKRG